MSNNSEPQPTPSDLGAPVGTFSPMLGNVIAGFIICALMVAGGAAALGFPLRAAYLADWNLPVSVEKGWSWVAVGLACLMGVFLLLCGYLLSGYCRGLLTRRVELFEGSFRSHFRGGVEDVPWSSVARVRQLVLYERPPILKGAAALILPKLMSTSYELTTTAGKHFVFDGDAVREIRRFGETLKPIAERHSVTWETVEQHA